MTVLPDCRGNRQVCLCDSDAARSRRCYLKVFDLGTWFLVDEVRHPIFREALRMQNRAHRQIEITTLADIPAGTDWGRLAVLPLHCLKGVVAHRAS